MNALVSVRLTEIIDRFLSGFTVTLAENVDQGIGRLIAADGNHALEQGAEFSVVMPEDWDGGAVRAKLMWTAFDSTKAEQGEVVAWKIGAVSTPDEGAITVAPTNYVTVTDNLSQVNELHRTGATGQIAAEGTRGAGNLVHFVVKRDPSAETANPMDTEALLLGVWLQYGRTSSVTEEWS